MLNRNKLRLLILLNENIIILYEIRVKQKRNWGSLTPASEGFLLLAWNYYWLQFLMEHYIFHQSLKAGISQWNFHDVKNVVNLTQMTIISTTVESLRRNGVAIIVNKKFWNAVLERNFKNYRMISIHFQANHLSQ